jgi:hypothetical protein
VLAVALVATITYGLARLATARFEPGPRVALLQSNLMQRYQLFGCRRILPDQMLDQRLPSSPP